MPALRRSTMSVALFDLIRAHLKQPICPLLFLHLHIDTCTCLLFKWIPLFFLDRPFGLSDSSTAVIQSESSDEGSGQSANSSQADSIAACILSIVGDIFTIGICPENGLYFIPQQQQPLD